MLVGSAAALPGLPSRSMVADVGCGRGWLLGAAALDVTIVNIDSYVWPEWALSQHVLHVCASADALPFRDGTFDVVGSFDVLEHLPDDEAALGEQRRVVRPNGRVVVAVPADRRLWSPHDDAVGHFRRYDVPELRALADRSGLRVERCTRFFSFLWLPAWLGRNRATRPAEPGNGKGVVGALVRGTVGGLALSRTRPHADGGRSRSGRRSGQSWFRTIWKRAPIATPSTANVT